MSGIADSLISLLGVQPDPVQAILAAGGAGGAPAPQPPQGGGAPVAAAGGPATTIAPQGGGAPAAPTQAPGSSQSSPDMQQLYMQLLQRNEKKDQINSGLSLIAAGFARPENRAALVQSAGGGGGSAQSSAASTIATLLQLRQLQQQQATATAQKQRLPDIAKQLGVPLTTAQYLNDSGKLDDALAKAAEPNNEIKTYSDGRTVLIDKTNGKVIQDYGGQKEDDAQPKQTALIENMRTNWQKLGLPDPASQNPADQQWWKDTQTHILAPGGGGVNVNVGGGAEKAKDQAQGQEVGKAIGQEAASYISAGDNANKMIPLLDSMQGALDASKGAYTGPFADYVLGSKEALHGAFGIESGNDVTGQETARKLGQTLAAGAAKLISSRPSQLEYMSQLNAQPGIYISPEGSKAVIDLNKQLASQQLDLSQLAHDPANQGNMNEVARKYYESHPIKSPFNPGENFGQADMNTLLSAAGKPPVLPNGKPAPIPSAPLVANLRAHPDTADKFDEYFGKGMAYHFLRGAGQDKFKDNGATGAW